MTSFSDAPNESPATIVQEETWLQGTFLSGFFFGIQVTLYATSFLAVLNKRTQNSRVRTALLAYIVGSFAITMTAQGILFYFIQMGFITHRNFPGGPSAFFNDEYSIPVSAAQTVLVVLASWLDEALLVWRCYVVCSPGGHVWLLGMYISLFLLLAVFGSGSFFIHSALQSAPSVSSTLAYGVSSLVLNLVATGFIAGRLLVYRRYIVTSLGGAQGQRYVSIIAIVVESAAVYTGFLIFVIVVYAIGSPVGNTLQQVIEQIQTITSLLIILRVARGEGWNSSAEKEVKSAVLSSWNARAGTHMDQSVTLTQLNVATRQESSVLPCLDETQPQCLSAAVSRSASTRERLQVLPKEEVE